MRVRDGRIDSDRSSRYESATTDGQSDTYGGGMRFEIALRKIGAGIVAVGLCTTSAYAAGSTGTKPMLGIVWGVPFAGLLLSIAVLPLLLPTLWHHHYGKIAALWAAAFLVPFAAFHGVPAMTTELLHTILLDYIPFIVLVGSLFVVAGGLHIRGRFSGTPLSNTALLAFGTLIASFVGTTGASMLMIRPLISANDGRPFTTHVFVFFIFLVSNVGGALTPLGDPPLFIGFLQGVDFFWTVRVMWPVTALVAGILLVIFYVLDSYYARKERPPIKNPAPTAAAPKFGLIGIVNLLLLAGLVGIVLWSGIAMRSSDTIKVYGLDVPLVGLVRDAGLVGVAALSLWLTPKLAREGNDFSFGPILEVAKLFAAIFVTIVPVLIMLRSGREGALAGLVDLVTGPGGKPNDAMYFWLSGGLSSFLDNAPTYLVFFNLAGGNPVDLMGTLGRTLMAISAGSVFMGANTYIGNAPNFMVKAVCEQNGVKMPSFFGYMGWSIVVLLPIFALVTVIFFR
jgi:Na+/H+ antiporter NhaD/arsenite permease-like protein